MTSFKYDAYGNVTEKTNPDGTINITEYDGLQREKATYFKANSESVNQILTSTEYEFVKNHGFDIYTALDSCSSKSCSGLKTIKTTYITVENRLLLKLLPISEEILSLKKPTAKPSVQAHITQTDSLPVRQTL